MYCSALGLVVIGLLGYVIFKHWRRLRAKRRHIKVRDPHDDVEYSKASGADSGVFVENDSPKNYTCKLLNSLLFCCYSVLNSFTFRYLEQHYQTFSRNGVYGKNVHVELYSNLQLSERIDTYTW